MKLLSIRTALAGMWLTTAGAFAADSLWSNTGLMFLDMGEAPQIDATNFYNSGTIDLLTLLPFETQNTLNFTNRGVLRGSVGFQFDTVPAGKSRRPAANFVNQRGGNIEAYEYISVMASNTIFYPNYIIISATNIVNEGTMTVGNAGLLRLEGKNIDCTRGGFQVGSLTSSGGGGNYPDGTYFPDAAVYDVYWGTGIEPDQQNYPAQDTANIIRYFGADMQTMSPPHMVATASGGGGYARVGSSSAIGFGYTNINGGVWLTLTNDASGTLTNLFAPTNIIRQAVLVGLGDTNNFKARAKFYPSQLGGVTFNTASVEIQMQNSNVVLGTIETNTLYIVDRLASETNMALWTNLTAVPQSYRPAAYEVMRTMPFEFGMGFNGNATIDKNFAWNTGFSNRFVTNFYAGYRANLDFLAVRPPIVPDMGPTEQPGRIEIVGDNVDLTKARFQGMGLISVKAKNLVSSSNAVVDSSSLIYNLGSTTGLLTIQNLAKTSANRMDGPVRMWSGLWTNYMALVLTNWYVDANTNYFNPVTNAIEVGIHVWVLEADFLSATQEVIVHDLIARSTNIVLNDSVAVVRSLILEGEGFTVNGSLTLTNTFVATYPESIPDFVHTNIPGIRYFTNNGVINVPNIAYYGADAARPLDRFVNRGTLNGFDNHITAQAYEESGVINSSNTITVIAGSAKFEGGRYTCRGAIRVSAGEAKLRNQRIDTATTFFLDVTNNLSDAGITGPNTISVDDGFHLARKPKTGDLLGTTFESAAPAFASVTHSWAGEDRGPTPQGFQDNAAVGGLSLNVMSGAELRFHPPLDASGNPLPGNYALYVDVLNLSSAITADVESALVIDPGMTIYFATANVTPSTIDGLCNGRLRWVRDYAGPSSGIPVASYQGGGVWKTIIVNSALFNSDQIDSDGDGLANAYDTRPFDGVALKSAEWLGTTPPKFKFSWEAAAQTVYRIEYAPSITPANWTLLQTITNAALVTRTLTITNTLPAAGGTGAQRYYRVRYDP